ncbi:MAG: hypothetical protein WA061_01680 [Microgenomates group bacterium]
MKNKKQERYFVRKTMNYVAVIDDASMCRRSCEVFSQCLNPVCVSQIWFAKYDEKNEAPYIDYRDEKMAYKLCDKLNEK